MNKKITFIKNLSLLIAFFGMVNLGFGQISIIGLGAGNTHTENFNTLANSGTSNTVPAGWAFSESDSGANTSYTAGTGSSNTGDTYSFGSAASTERSFGGLLSSTLNPTIGVSFTNNTGSTVTELTISYTGEQWRLGATGRTDRLDFQYSLNATSLTTGTWVDEDSLDFVAPITTGSTGALDGNLSTNRTVISFTITGLSITNGSTFWLRWTDYNASGSDDGLGVDDFSIYATACTPPTDPSGSISGNTPECESTTLSYSAPDANIYWQDSTTGTSTTLATTSDYDVSTSGTYYVRAYNGTCWSDNAVSYNVVINYSPVIDTQPKDKAITTGSNVTFTVATTNASSYQWQQSIDSGVTWTNVGTDSDTFTISGVPITYDGYKYKVVVSSTDCGTITSNIVTLNVFDSTCIDEDFVAFGDWTNSGTSANTDIAHYGNASPCRAIASGNSIISPSVDYPRFLRFYQDSSNTGDGNTATIEYRIGSGSWVSLYSFSVTTVGKVETVDLSNISGINLSNQTNITFRFNSSFNTWYLDDVLVFCTPCTPPTITATSNLSSGPIGTQITISGSNFTAASTVSFNGISATIVSWTTNTLIVNVPVGATDGDITVSTPTICDSYISFDVFDNENNSCQTTIMASDLFIYEVFDEDNDVDTPIDYGNGGMITIFNGTLQTLNLSDYRLYRTTNYNDTSTYPYVLWFSPTGNLAPGEIYRIRVSASVCTSYESPYSNVAVGFNADDGIELRKFNSSTSNYDTIDQVLTPDAPGYYMVRDLTSSPIPNTTYNTSNWNIDTLDAFTCVSVGVAPSFYGGLPSISSVSNPSNVCDTASLTVNAIEGYNTGSPVDTKPLDFEWYYNDGLSDIWNLITTGGDFSVSETTDDALGNGSSTLDISNAYDKINYQFYCRVRENDATCYTATDAIILDIYTTTWTSSGWIPTNPDISTVAIIDYDFDTEFDGGSFSACSLIVNDGFILNIADGNYVEVQNDLTVNGNVLVQPQGSFVQNNDSGLVNGTILSDKTKIVVIKKTAPMNNWYEYTYWSSPVKGEKINLGLAEATPNRRFWFNAQNFLDECYEVNNDNSCTPGQDDIDDDAPYDWTLANGTDTMLNGIGYASTHRSDLFFAPPPATLPYQFDYTFEGPFNNGIITVPVYRNDSELNDINWNLIGNPYPSAIDVDKFLNANSIIATDVISTKSLNGAIFLWSQNTPPSATTNGNQKLNFSDLDYAIINGTGELAGGDGLQPDRYIPSGQGFFVNYSNTGATKAVNGDINTGEVIFNNAMRVTGNNNQFFKTSHVKPSKLKGNSNKLWVNLTSDVGIFSQVLIGYVDGATNGFDGMYYDVPRIVTTRNASALYSLIDNNTSKYAIQGKEPGSLNLDEVIPLGFHTAISGANLYKLSIDQFEGDFFNTNTVYLKDNLMHKVHNLSESDYTFTSEVGEFNSRFEIVFQAQTLSDIEAQINSNKLTVIELNDGRVQFKTNSNFTIKTVTIFDVLGRTLYKLQGSNTTEIYNLTHLSQSAYITKVELSNGQIVTKKALKRI